MKKWEWVLVAFIVFGFFKLAHGEESVKGPRTNDVFINDVVRAPTYIVFGDPDHHDEYIGKLDWSTGELKFTGKADKATRAFFDYMLKTEVDEYIRSHMKECIDVR